MSAPAAVAAANAPSTVSQAQSNADYMARSRRFPVRAPLVGGALNGTYAFGSTLNFIFGPVNNGWLETVEIDLNISLQIAVATVNPNAGYPWNLIQAVTVNLDGQISYCEPYFACYILPILKGRLRHGIDKVLAGGDNANEDSIVFTAPASLTVGAQAIRVRYRIPLNALHPLDGSGLLPTQGTQDPVQINVICPSGGVGNDPWNFPGQSATGTAAVNAGSTVTVYGWVRDGRTKWAPSEQLPFYPDGLPQVSYDREPDIVNLVANQIVRGQLTKVLKIYYMICVLIDGNASTAWCANTNVNSFDVAADSSGNFEFMQFGLNNIPIDLLWEDQRNTFGQDLPQGIVVVAAAPVLGLPEPGLQNGTDILNMTNGGWTSLYVGINFATINTANFQPRVHTCIVGTNDSPYIG